MRYTFFLIIPSVFIVAIAALFLYDSTNLDKICQDEGGKRIGDVCKIPIPSNSTSSSISTTSNSAKVTTMVPDSMKFFFYPDPEEDFRDLHRVFMLIRLPEWMGGAANDASAFRAYSAKSIDDACIVRYWPGPERQRIENPCQGGMYRVVDGALTEGQIYSSNKLSALPHLDLTLDENGVLYIEPPKWTKTDNGVIGYGRQMTYEELSEGSKFLIDSFKNSFPQFPPIPLEFAGYLLSEIVQNGQDRFIIKYFDFTSGSGLVTMLVNKCNCNDSMYLNVNDQSFEIWQLGDTRIIVSGSAMNKESSIPESLRMYDIHFFKNSFEFIISCKNVELMKKQIVMNYFADFKYTDMMLISKTQ